MNTPTHMLVSLASLGRRGDPRRNGAAVAGAAIPDVPIFVLFVVARYALGQPSREIWTRTYFEPAWQLAVDLTHSIPIALLGLAIAAWRGSVVWRTIFASILLHAALDLPVHTDDAHRHFLPLGDWRFHSPVSYWDPRSYGRQAALVEIVAALALAVRAFRLLTSRAARGVVAAVAVVYAAGATVLLRPCLSLPWLASLTAGDGRCDATPVPNAP